MFLYPARRLLRHGCRWGGLTGRWRAREARRSAGGRADAREDRQRVDERQAGQVHVSRARRGGVRSGKGGKRGWAMLDGDVALTHRMTIKIGDAPARDATIKGKTVDDTGAPVADVLVTASRKTSRAIDAPPRAVAFATSGPDGTFTRRGRRQEAVHVDRRRRRPRAASQARCPRWHARRHADARRRSCRSRARSSTASDKPVAVVHAARHEARRPRARGRHDAIGDRSARPLQRERREGRLRAARVGDRAGRRARRRRSSAGTTDAKIKLASGATLVGTVVDVDTGTPLPYARIMREGAGGGASTQPANAGTVTRADGTFELTGIPAGPFAITIGAGELQPADRRRPRRDRRWRRRAA